MVLTMQNTNVSKVALLRGTAFSGKCLRAPKQSRRQEFSLKTSALFSGKVRIGCLNLLRRFWWHARDRMPISWFFGLARMLCNDAWRMYNDSRDPIGVGWIAVAYLGRLRSIPCYFGFSFYLLRHCKWLMLLCLLLRILDFSLMMHCKTCA